jgi:hypothetical protein
LIFDKRSIVIFLTVAAVFFLYAGTVLYVIWPIQELSIANAGVFGDSFGIITAFFSALAFAGILLTIRLQRKELAEARKVFKLQRFEGSFYRLLEFYRKNLESVRVKDNENGSIYLGVDAFNFVCKKINEKVYPLGSILPEDDEAWKAYENDLVRQIHYTLVRQARYLDTLLNILELIERDIKTDKKRMPYWNILASQMTSQELKYIFYRNLIAEKDDRLRELIHKSGILDKWCNYEGTGTGKTQLALYNRLHVTDFKSAKKTIDLPHNRHEVREIKKRLRKK